jgi:hypothetical protein
MASLLVSMVILGFKLTMLKDIVHLTYRRKELKANLAMLLRRLEGENLVQWLDDVSHDVKARQKKIDAMDFASGHSFSAMENDAIARCMGMFVLFEAHSSGTKQRQRLAPGIRRLETKHDAASGLLLGRAEAEIRASTQEIIAFWLDDNSRYQKSIYKADANCVRAFGPEPVNHLHAITFRRCCHGPTHMRARAHARTHDSHARRYKSKGLQDRTFLNSVIAKRVAEDPPTYLIAIVPTARHDEITAKDEAGAIRADVCRSFKLTTVAPLATKVEYVCSLDLKGSVPQQFTNAVAIPVQMTVPRWLHLYFQQLLPLTECTADDGRVAGLLLIDVAATNPKNRQNAVREFAHRTAMLRQCSFRHIGAMLAHMLCPDAERGSEDAAASIAASLDQADPALVMEHEAETIGTIISRSHLAIHRTVALHSAVLSFPVLRTMASRYVWFVPMLEALVDPRAAELHRDAATWIEDVAYDMAQRQDRIAAMESAPGCAYTCAENELIEKGMALFTRFESSSKSSVTELKHSATVTRLETNRDAATGRLLGRATAEVCATPQEIVAYLLNYDGRHLHYNDDPAVDVRDEILQYVNAHHAQIFNRKRARGVRDRTFLNSVVGKKTSDDPLTYVLVGVPIPDHAKVSLKDEAGAIRAENFRSFRCTEVTPGRTQMDYVCSLDLKGLIPQILTNNLVIPGQMHIPRTLQLYFLQLRPPIACSAEDGRVAGHLLMDVEESKPTDLPHSVRTFTNRMAMLRECSFPHIGEMLVSLLAYDVRHASKDAVAPASSHDAPSMTLEQAATIGRTIASRIASSPFAPATAVHALVNSHYFLRGMSSACAWFVPMLDAIVDRKAGVHSLSRMKRTGSIVAPEDVPLASVGETGNNLNIRDFDSVVHPLL